ncbi:MAG: winged helix-turn-helix transcriptional regulator [Bacteroidaceae bacterium]|nr:winged helix-turn-helix transcriptional regulator [Bacteroidaceae bacterium]
MNIPIAHDIEIDREARRVLKGGRDVQLTGLEFGLLDYLASHPNKVCTRDDILDHVWGSRFRYDSGTIDVHLSALRRKLGWSSKRPIETIRGLGLIFRHEWKTLHYTIDLQMFLTSWLYSHEVEIVSAGLVAQLHLTPFVNELTIEPEALRQMLDSFLTALLPGAQPGVLRVSSRLTIHCFFLSIDINGTVCELRIPIYEGSDVS